MFYYFFSYGLVSFDAIILITVLRLYQQTKQSVIGTLALWFGSRFLSVFLPYIWNDFFGWTTVHIQNFSVLVEGVLMVHFCKLLLAKETKLWRLLYALTVMIYIINLSVVLYNSKLLFIVYPVFFTICVLFDTISTFYFRKHTQHFIQTLYQSENAY